MSAGHTPGPWFVYPQHSYRFTIGDYNGGAGPCCVIADCAPRECLTGTGDHTKSDAESEANARLIAAAPELLAALQRMLAEFGGDTGGIGAKGRCEALCIAGEEVAKATGESE